MLLCSFNPFLFFPFSVVLSASTLVHISTMMAGAAATCRLHTVQTCSTAAERRGKPHACLPVGLHARRSTVYPTMMSQHLALLHQNTSRSRTVQWLAAHSLPALSPSDPRAPQSS
jgi:hypothetical protein